jgi:hypothetical protein
MPCMPRPNQAHASGPRRSGHAPARPPCLHASVPRYVGQRERHCSMMRLLPVNSMCLVSHGGAGRKLPGIRLAFGRQSTHRPALGSSRAREYPTPIASPAHPLKRVGLSSIMRQAIYSAHLVPLLAKQPCSWRPFPGMQERASGLARGRFGLANPVGLNSLGHTGTETPGCPDAHSGIGRPTPPQVSELAPSPTPPTPPLSHPIPHPYNISVKGSTCAPSFVHPCPIRVRKIPGRAEGCPESLKPLDPTHHWVA